MDLPLFATVPKGMESLLAGELRGLGAHTINQVRAGVSFSGSLETAYRVCLWSRLASRVLLPLTTGRATSSDELYATAQKITWNEHMGVDGTLAVDFTGVSDAIRDTRFGAVRVKDAIVDQFRRQHGDRRPSVDARAPDLRISAHLARGRLTLSLDLSGDSLHRRGYRTDKTQVEAPLKENLAAAVLIYAQWPREAASGGSFLDPLCGSGTLPIEAAWMAADIAPGLLRAESLSGFGFLRWKGHDDAVWQRLVAEASGRRATGLARLEAAGPDVVIRGSDRDTRALDVAQTCVTRAGLDAVVTLERLDLAEQRAPAHHGLLATNAPYGERLGESEDSEAVYRLLGRRLREAFGGWRVAVLAGQRRQIEAMGLPAKRETTLYNGALPCPLAYFDIEGAAPAAAPRSARAAVRSSAVTMAAEKAVDETPVDSADHAISDGLIPDGLATPESPTLSEDPASLRSAGLLSGGAEHFANRLRKNLRHLGRQLGREGISCYRLYDADLPEYNLVVDVYGDWVHVQEYAPPIEIDPAKVRRRLEDAMAVIATVLKTPVDHLVLKERRRQRGTAQYERLAVRGSFHEVTENGLTYLVNLTDYLDTGLYIDQRLTRRLVRQLADGRRFLSLFAYTGTMTASALAGGASASTTVDLSSTYLEWAQRNLEANGFAASLELSGAASAPPAAHRLVQADCLRWIAEDEGAYDLIWLDPPTFSNSKRMGRATFDVQRDHADLLRLTARRLLAPGGTLLFSTNRRGFKLDIKDLGGLRVEDLSRTTLPFDCERGANRHHVFSFKRKRAS